MKLLTNVVRIDLCIDTETMLYFKQKKKTISLKLMILIFRQTNFGEVN